MFGAIYVGLSGLRAYSNGIQRVSNNVANLNSLGFRASTVTFSNVQTARDYGGISFQNGALGHGGGVGLYDASLNLRSGELRQTENDLDLAIDGNGFLTLLRGTETRYIRTGSFDVDRDGYVVLAGTDWKLGVLDGAGRATPVSIDASRTNVPAVTTRINFADNLSSTATAYTVSDMSVYDASGAKHLWTATFTRTSGTMDWKVKVTDDKGITIGEQTLAFLNGAPTSDTNQLTFADTANALSVVFDFSSNVTSFSAGTVSTLRAAKVDGHAVGSIASIAVNTKGELELSYSNNEKKQIGPVAIAVFRDAHSLRQESAGQFTPEPGADVQLLSSEDPRGGQVLSRRLEASNVDLSQEFGDLILIQRGYQASSQIISVSNDMIQQLFGIRGQG
ncbi:MAG: flagellar hook-basal body complex protein [Novosphingobium sp.]|uniref:flagellar hook-basal body complex protein n=1 Tax=Novosphingobium sp. TaxID=1874826 RepID=UPI0032B7A3F7